MSFAIQALRDEWVEATDAVLRADNAGDVAAYEVACRRLLDVERRLHQHLAIRQPAAWFNAHYPARVPA